MVEVSDDRDPRLSGGAPHTGYTSPPQELSRALELVTVLFGATETPTANGPWRVAIAGGRRTITLHPARADGQLLIG